MKLFLLLVLASAPLAPERPSQDPARPAGVAVVERLAAWPALAAGDEARAKLAVERLVAANTPAMEQGGREESLALGAALAPRLLEALGRARDAAAISRIEGVLDAAIDARHTRLLAAEFDAREAPRRRWALSRASRYLDAGIREQAERAWVKADERLEAIPDDGKRAQERLEEARAERFAAALAATSAGSSVALDTLLEHASSDWKESAAPIRAAAVGARGEQASAMVAARVRTDSGLARLAALRLLTLVGVGADATSVALAMLDDHDMAIRMAAINALRAVVDGAPPMDDLSAFESVEHADAWKKRLK